MARIRSVKPEMFTSTTVAGLPMPVRWTFVGLLTYADDQGRGRDEARLVKAAVWPLDDDVSWQRVAEHLDELERAGLICRYEADGKRLLHVSGWTEHQAISHPAKAKFPDCPKASHRNPPDGHRKLSGESPEERRETPQGKEQGKEQGTGKGSNTVVDPATPDRPVGADDGELRIRQVFRVWLESMGEDPAGTRYQLTPARRQKIRARLRQYPFEDVADAARGWRRDPWPERVNHNDLTVLLRNGEQVEKFRDLYRKGPPLVMGKRTAEMVRNAQAMRVWAEQMERDGNDGTERMGASRPAAQRELPRPAD